jgi:hypothetical protein
MYLSYQKEHAQEPEDGPDYLSDIVQTGRINWAHLIDNQSQTCYNNDGIDHHPFVREVALF